MFEMNTTYRNNHLEYIACSFFLQNYRTSLKTNSNQSTNVNRLVITLLNYICSNECKFETLAWTHNRPPAQPPARFMLGFNRFFWFIEIIDSNKSFSFLLSLFQNIFVQMTVHMKLSTDRPPARPLVRSTKYHSTHLCIRLLVLNFLLF